MSYLESAAERERRMHAECRVAATAKLERLCADLRIVRHDPGPRTKPLDAFERGHNAALGAVLWAWKED